MADSVWVGFKMGMKTTVAIGALVMAMGQTQAQAQTVPDNWSASPTDAAPPQSRDKKSAVDDSASGSDIVVTGTHIAGAVTPSPVYVLTNAEIKAAGQRDLGEAIRSLPFNFNGGQNPGVAQYAVGIANQNITNGSAANLRGLGPDATLTLLNGHRLAYGGFAQGVDISAIPLAAVSSIQIVPDGSSALYGSDAVGGVVNVVLRSDFNGGQVSAQLGAPTDGGGFQQQYDGTFGRSWGNGGIMIAGQYQHQDPIYSSQRSYTDYMPMPADLLARSRQWSGLVSAHQDLTESLTFSLDALYSNRSSFIRYSPSDPASRIEQLAKDESYLVAPSLTYRIGSRWSSTLSGVYGSDSGKSQQATIDVPSNDASYSNGCDCNRVKGVELGFEGPLFHLGGGTTNLAIGGGYRENSYYSISYPSGNRTGGKRHNYFAYGEFNIPVVGSQNAVPGIANLTLSAAGRFESYSDFGDVATPKLGIIYSPVEGIDLKASWGQSFKAPTFLQMYQRSYVFLYPAAWMGATGLPASAATLLPYGGNPNLRPEKSENWSATIDVHPAGIRGLHASLTYFKVSYRDRVVQPIDLGTALINPVYAPFIHYSPSPAEQAAVIAAAQTFTSYAGVYNPNNVIAIAEDRYINAARQRIQGVDLTSRYEFSLMGGVMNVSGSGSWIKSEQQIGEGTAFIPLAGYIFNPPHFRARASAGWSSEVIDASTFLNYISGVRDQRTGTDIEGNSMTTVDLTLGAHLRSGLSSQRDLDISLSIQNLLDAKPPYLRPAADYAVNYDSTNYSPIGRVLRFTVSTRF